MGRNPELEAIFQARYDLESCEPSQKTERRARLDSLIEAVLARAGRPDLSTRTFMVEDRATHFIPLEPTERQPEG